MYIAAGVINHRWSPGRVGHKTYVYNYSRIQGVEPFMPLRADFCMLLCIKGGKKAALAQKL